MEKTMTEHQKMSKTLQELAEKSSGEWDALKPELIAFVAEIDRTPISNSAKVLATKGFLQRICGIDGDTLDAIDRVKVRGKNTKKTAALRSEG